MRNLKRHRNNSFSWFEKIVDEKYNPQRGVLQLIQPNVKKAYSQYNSLYDKNELEKIHSSFLNDNEINALCHCYDSSTTSRDKLIELIHNHSIFELLNTCPYCLINSDNTTDHFVPKTKYPDFAVMKLNLLPCCGQCNLLKGEEFRNPNGTGIINYYTDKIPNEQFLFADIRYTNNLPKIKFYLKNNGKIESTFFKLAKSHFETLELYDRYKNRFNKVYSIAYKTFKNKPKFRNNSKLIRETMKDDIDGLIKSFGINYWEAVVKIALVNSTDFIDIVKG